MTPIAVVLGGLIGLVPLLWFFVHIVRKDGWKVAGIVFVYMGVAVGAASLVIYLINLVGIYLINLGARP